MAPFHERKTGPHIAGLPKEWQKAQWAHIPEWLVQYKLASTPEPKGFQLGQSLRGSLDLEELAFSEQTIEETTDTLTIQTTLEHTHGYVLRHQLIWPRNAPYVQMATIIDNTTKTPLTLDYLASFSLGRLTPFSPGEATEALYLHRFRSQWSAEGRHERLLLEDLNLERSWGGYSRRSERFGQIGSMPVRGYFPWIALEDQDQQVFWGAQLATPGSWQLECSRRTDKVTLSGGLPARDFGEWWKTLVPGESFCAPPVTLATVQGDLDDLCHVLTRAQVKSSGEGSQEERDLPIVFNEWCTSWGEPSEEAIEKSMGVLASTRTKIIVIDDGWAEKPVGQGIQHNGDWETDRKKFPRGLGPVAQKIRDSGMIPGLWFEMEVATKGTKAFSLEERLLRRQGSTVQVGNRHFWDFRDPETVRILTRKIIERLREDNFGYLKIDYNETLPSGIDGEESPGEELRKHLLGVQSFIQSIREAIPGIIIENCSSGGHRLEPSFQRICDVGSFSDAHETWSIPIIAANLHRLILPHQSQIWCVLHRYDALSRLRYGLAATFLGRMAISGEIDALADWQRREVQKAQDFLDCCGEIIRNGMSRIIRDLSPSWNCPRGWQLVSRISPEGNIPASCWTSICGP
ncbi:MAG: alpha-galactosidase [Opitutales bacterium]|nr:alpha-galactosidase [Opitutales bacterium]